MNDAVEPWCAENIAVVVPHHVVVWMTLPHGVHGDVIG